MERLSAHFPRSRFRNRIAEFRSLLGFSQADLAALVGVSKNTISNFECGIYSPSSYRAYLLCIALGVPYEDLFYVAEPFTLEVDRDDV